MSFINKALLKIENPVTIAKRFRGKINIQKPRAPHFERQLLIDIAKPIYGPPKHKQPEIELCDKGLKWNKEEIDNPFERILARECLNWFNTSKMVIFLHMNSISMEDKLPVFANLRKQNMHLRTYGKKIVSMATTGTRYEVVNQLFTSHQNIIFGQTENVTKMFKILKKSPQMIVLAGIINDRLLSKNELVEYSQLPSLNVARSQLCNVLQSAGSCLVSQMQQGQQLLVSNLDQHVEIQNKETATPPSIETEETATPPSTDDKKEETKES